MFRTYRINTRDTGFYNPLVADYIEQKSQLREFYELPPSKKSLLDFAAQHAFININRAELSRILSEQASLVANTSEASIKNIALLKEANVFTVTTGHQLCLFTGPLYFIYKIFSVINICEELNAEGNNFRFVPVYWAASEDHDFEEVNHFNAFGKKISWQSEQSGAVGTFSTAELEKHLDEITQLFGNSTEAEELISLFKRAYLQHKNLVDATRYLVNELFGQYGLVVADGNDPALKTQFKQLFQQDIIENRFFKKVAESAEKLKELGYHAQVTPRPVNCFYLDKGIRARLEKNGESYEVAGAEIKFSEQQLLALIENETHKLSPNVVLRPLYQQHILPNAAYAGGPGELAYWLQYRAMFNDADVPFPVLIPRASFTIIEKNLAAKTDKLGLSLSDLFNNEHDLIRIYLEGKEALFDAQQEQTAVASVFEKLSERIEKIDPTLVASAKAELQKAMNSIEALKAKANRAIKQKSDTQINQLKNIKDKLFPGASPQERHENFSVFFLKWGKNFFRELKQNTRPFDFAHTVLREEE